LIIQVQVKGTHRPTGIRDCLKGGITTKLFRWFFLLSTHPFTGRTDAIAAMKPSTATGTAAATAKPAKQEVMSQTLPDNHRNATNALLATLAQVEVLLAPLFTTPTTLSETMAKLDMEKRCQLELLMTFAINTLAYSTWFLPLS
jgi:hypothetical protein